MRSDDATLDVVLSIGVLAFASVVAGGYVELPATLLKSTEFALILIIGSLAIFALYPMVGFSLFFLIAVLLFKRNILTALSYAKNNFEEAFFDEASAPIVAAQEAASNAPPAAPLAAAASATAAQAAATAPPGPQAQEATASSQQAASHAAATADTKTSRMTSANTVAENAKAAALSSFKAAATVSKAVEEAANKAVAEATKTEGFTPNVTVRRNPIEWREHFDPNVTVKRNPMEWKEHFANEQPNGVMIPSSSHHALTGSDYSNEVPSPHRNPNLPTLLMRNDSPSVDTHPQTENPEILNTGNTVYGNKSIMMQEHSIPLPHSDLTIHSQPRLYKDFAETTKTNPTLGPIVEGYQPANYGDETVASVEGQYPIESQRAFEVPEERGFAYFPNSETGTNNFIRTPSKLVDEKMMPLKY